MDESIIVAHTYIYTTMEYDSTIKNEEILPSATIWTDLGSTMLSETSHAKKDNSGIKQNKYQNAKLIEKEIKLKVTKRQSVGGRGNWRKLVKRHKLPFKKINTY